MVDIIKKWLNWLKMPEKIEMVEMGVYTMPVTKGFCRHGNSDVSWDPSSQEIF